MNIQEEIIPKFSEFDFIKKIILFGSRIHKPDAEKSDIDLCFVIDDDAESDLIFKKISNILSEEKIFIHPVIFNQTEFEKKMHISIYKNEIQKKGRVLYKR